MYWANIQGASVFIYLQWTDEFQVNLCLPQPSLLYPEVFHNPLVAGAAKNSKLCIRYFVSTVKKKIICVKVNKKCILNNQYTMCVLLFSLSLFKQLVSVTAHIHLSSHSFRLSYMWPWIIFSSGTSSSHYLLIRQTLFY